METSSLPVSETSQMGLLLSPLTWNPFVIENLCHFDSNRPFSNAVSKISSASEELRFRLEDMFVFPCWAVFHTFANSPLCLNAFAREQCSSALTSVLPAANNAISASPSPILASIPVLLINFEQSASKVFALCKSGNLLTASYKMERRKNILTNALATKN